MPLFEKPKPFKKKLKYIPEEEEENKNDDTKNSKQSTTTKKLNETIIHPNEKTNKNIDSRILIKFKDPLKPIKPPFSGYNLFCKHHFGLLNDNKFDGGKNMKIIAKKWKLLSENQKNKWNEKSKRDKAKYFSKKPKYLIDEKKK